MNPREYCHWLKGALDLGGGGILSRPDLVEKALKELPSDSEGPGQRSESDFCSWMRGVAEASLGMAPPAGLPARVEARAKARLEELLKSSLQAKAPYDCFAEEEFNPLDTHGAQVKFRC